MKAFDDHLEAVLRAGVPGAMVVANGPALSWGRAAGVADAESGAPMTSRHRFLIGSVSKTFVAAVVLQLVEEGALALDEEVGPIAEGVTLRQLLNHTSGLPDYYADFDSLIAPYRADRGYKPDLTPRGALELVHARPRLFPPGAGWEYSGGNYLALGLIVEEATGATLREELRRRIAQPLGLEGTDLRDRAGLARAYLQPGNPVFPDAGEGLDDVTDIELFGWGAGLRLGGERRLRPGYRGGLVAHGTGTVTLRLGLGAPRLRDGAHDDRAVERVRRPPGRDPGQHPGHVRRDVGGSRRSDVGLPLRRGLSRKRRWYPGWTASRIFSSSGVPRGSRKRWHQTHDKSARRAMSRCSAT
jgi:CubicO group peptidase (beta-lactamase class C family)